MLLCGITLAAAVLAAVLFCVTGFASKFSVIARPVRRLVVAIPQLERKCIDNFPTEW